MKSDPLIPVMCLLGALTGLAALVAVGPTIARHFVFRLRLRKIRRLKAVLYKLAAQSVTHADQALDAINELNRQEQELRELLK